jgi:23S rRNA (adenine2503-C2)-methyltransferase
MRNLYDLELDELGVWLKELGEPAFRAKQIWGWLYERKAARVEDMTDLPRGLREKLLEHAVLDPLEIADEQVAKDGTVKRLYRLGDGQLIEAVLMKYDDDRRTACISSQAGCAMACAFCATGQMGFARHLSSGEIVAQVIRYARELEAVGERLSNIVLMGMGEPFHNYDAVLAAVRRLIRDVGIGARHITVSTVGLAPRIRAFADEGLQVKLAISLHASNDEQRSTIMPINRRYPIPELLDACAYYVEKTGRRVSFEWALIAGQNDDAATAHRLGKLIQHLPAHVNLIPLNPTARFDGRATDQEAARAFVRVLEGYGLPATIRVRRGIDIDAGCGQLKSKVIRRGSDPEPTSAGTPT